MRTVAHGVIRGFAMDKTETDLLREEKGSGAILFGTALAFAFPVETGSRLALCR